MTAWCPGTPPRPSPPELTQLTPPSVVSSGLVSRLPLRSHWELLKITGTLPAPGANYISIPRCGTQASGIFKALQVIPLCSHSSEAAPGSLQTLGRSLQTLGRTIQTLGRKRTEETLAQRRALGPGPGSPSGGSPLPQPPTARRAGVPGPRSQMGPQVRGLLFLMGSL